MTKQPQQIMIIPAENGFTIQSPGRKQFIAKDEAEVQSTVAQIITDLFKPEPAPTAKTQMVKVGPQAPQAQA